MKKEILHYKNYIAEVIFQPFYDDSTPMSKQYQLIIKKDNIALIKRYRFTRNGAITFFKTWVNKQESKL